MLAFEVSVNGKRQYVAGHPDGQTLNLTLFGGNNFRPAASVTTSLPCRTSHQAASKACHIRPGR